jgi:hypothetical protein
MACPFWLSLRGTPRPLLEIRSDVGVSPYKPLKAQGTRMLPAMSVPSESAVPRLASSALSPPELPPEVRALFQGLSVRPV